MFKTIANVTKAKNVLIIMLCSEVGRMGYQVEAHLSNFQL